MAVPADGGSAGGFEDTGEMAEAQSSAGASDEAVAKVPEVVEVEEQAIREQQFQAADALHQRLDHRPPCLLSPVNPAKAMRPER